MSVWHLKWKRLQKSIIRFRWLRGCLYRWVCTIYFLLPWLSHENPHYSVFLLSQSWIPSAMKVLLSKVQSILKLSTTVLQKIYLKFWKQVWCWSPLSRLLLQFSSLLWGNLFPIWKKSYPQTIAIHQFHPDTQIGIQIHCLFKESWSVVNVRIQSILKLCLQCSNARKNSVGLGMLCSNVPSACSYS